jgi:hypothetical protein
MSLLGAESPLSSTIADLFSCSMSALAVEARARSHGQIEGFARAHANSAPRTHALALAPCALRL